MKLLHSGKVRDVYSLDDDGDGDALVLVASDRVSIFDVVLPTPIPDKGAVLTRLSRWWFDRLADLVPNHVLPGPPDAGLPAEFAGRSTRCRRLDMLPVECVARGHLTGGGLAEYGRDGTVSGVPLPPGLVDGSRLPEPIFTPSTKAPHGRHDEPMTYGQLEALVGADTAARLHALTLAVYTRGTEIAARAGIIVADTKLEFGCDPRTGELVLADEVLTPDSSRFWPADRWTPGRPQPSFDKQFLRDWSGALDWDRTPPGPPVPPDVVAATRARYVTAYERITGETWT